jgi:hypothetical protein
MATERGRFSARIDEYVALEMARVIEAIVSRIESDAGPK